ncbi:Coiled-coil and C2 domain-containing protein 1B [Cichlidogyrus casuarinus]|uniref:Coiled-coil and C2 domain-containing protein 1B n=1 Tax=Cichlidogyrus casuarinus TaxID=1844966 RepID=A0ABD2QG74_9PLAT
MRGMIAAAESGLPVDMSQLPPKPNLNKSTSKTNISIISSDVVDPPIHFALSLSECDEDPQSIGKLLADTLNRQASQAEGLSEAQRRAGASSIADGLFVAADTSRRSTAFIKAHLNRNKIPSYRFVTAHLPVINLNPHLKDDALSVCAVRCVSLPFTENVETYVTFELPFPDSDSPQKHSTDWSAKTQNPEYYPKGTAVFEVNRKSRSFARFLGSTFKTLKASVYYRRGLLKSAGLIGTASIPLEELKTQATLEKSCELMVNRKPAGGIIVVRIQHPNAAPQLQSMNLLVYNYKLLEEHYRANVGNAAATVQSLKLRMDQMKTQHAQLKEAYTHDETFRKRYLSELPVIQAKLMDESRQMQLNGDGTKAQRLRERANEVQKEIISLTSA